MHEYGYWTAEFDGLGMDTPAADLEALRKLVIDESARLQRKISIIEIGSWVGKTAKAMIETECVDKIWCIDNWKGNHGPGDCLGPIADKTGSSLPFLTFCQNLRTWLVDTVIPVIGNSTDIANYWNQMADIIFIDAEHTYDAANEDINLWRKYVQPGGILCGHDYSGAFPGVVQAVNQAFGNDHIILIGLMIWVYRTPK